MCHSTDKLSDVLQKLIVEGFLSMPVISVHDGRFLGQHKNRHSSSRQEEPQEAKTESIG